MPVARFSNGELIDECREPLIDKNIINGEIMEGIQCQSMDEIKDDKFEYEINEKLENLERDVFVLNARIDNIWGRLNTMIMDQDEEEKQNRKKLSLFKILKIFKRNKRMEDKKPKYFYLSNPVKFEELEKAYAEGLIKIEDLKDRHFYFGYCRNASIAMWVDELNKFVYQREKFGSKFLEEINHPANDDGFDIFVTSELCEPPEKLKEYFKQELERWLKWKKEIVK